MIRKLNPLFAVCLVLVLSSGCADWWDQESETPTKELMQGVWEVTEAYDADGNSILEQISFPKAAFVLNDEDGVTCTAGPMFMYIVYGASAYVNYAAKVDQVFNYAELNFNEADFYLADGVVDEFTFVMRLKAPGAETIETLLQLIGIEAQYFNELIYHRFMNVGVSFSDNDRTMEWTFDDQTTAEYNIKDSQGRDVLWDGWSTDSFTRGRFILQKSADSLDDLITAAVGSAP